jgi:hypothetical protein
VQANDQHNVNKFAFSTNCVRQPYGKKRIVSRDMTFLIASKYEAELVIQNDIYRSIQHSECILSFSFDCFCAAVANFLANSVFQLAHKLFGKRKYWEEAVSIARPCRRYQSRL